jgi:hypothetical protein
VEQGMRPSPTRLGGTLNELNLNKLGYSGHDTEKLTA